MDKKSELRRDTENWVDRTFNYISLGVAEREAEHEGRMLFELIQTQEPDCDDAMEYHLYHADFTEDQEKEIQDEADENEASYYEVVLRRYEDEIRDIIINDDDNYPMWGTLFEFRFDPPEEWIEHAKEAGFGVIDAFGDFNTMLFVSGCGYSFYAQHWIPLYMKCIWGVADEYAGIDYSDL